MYTLSLEQKRFQKDLRAYIKQAVYLGVGEIIINSIDREGQMIGYDLDLDYEASEELSIPLIIHGGAGKHEHFLEALNAGAHAVAAGSMFVYFGAKKAVLITFTGI